MVVINNFFEKIYIRLLCVCAGLPLLFLAVTFDAVLVTANGIGTVVRDDVIGPYGVKVGINPFPAQTGRTTLSVSIEDVAGEPIVQSSVEALAKGPDGSAQGDVTLDFGTDPWDPIHHFAAFELSEPGTWTFDIQIDGRLGQADLQVPVDFVPQIETTSDNDGVPLMAIAVFAAVVLGAVASGVLVRFAKSRKSAS